MQPGESGPSGTLVTIIGVGFTNQSSVKFNGVNAASVTHTSSTQLKATAPPTATTGPITVTNNHGTDRNSQQPINLHRSLPRGGAPRLDCPVFLGRQSSTAWIWCRRWRVDGGGAFGPGAVSRVERPGSGRGVVVAL